MLLTITPNPPIDRTLDVPQMSVGAVHRAIQVHLTAGGKGINVTKVARLLGCQVLATGPLAGRAGQIFADLVKAEGISADWYWLQSGETRTCLLINHDASDATVINEPGPSVSDEDWQGFATHVKQLAAKVRTVAIAGSLPRGVVGEALAALARSLATSERTVYLDTSGAALAAALAQPSGLCIKVNRAELAAGLGMALSNIGQVVEAGQHLLSLGAMLVVVTLGAEGALVIAPEGCWQVSAPPLEVVSTVGSGDSLLAGLIVARLEGHPLNAALAKGVACGAANALTSFPARFERATVEALLEQISCTKLAV